MAWRLEERMFRDRREAGLRLAREIAWHIDNDPLFGGPDAERVVVALPRGGVPVALEIAREIGAPLDLVLVRKIGVPWQPELAAAAVVNGDDPIVVRNPTVISRTGMSALDLEQGLEREIAEIARRRERYLDGRAPVMIAGRVVIVVDDGIATGATALAALQGLRRRGPKALVLAVPVAPPDGLERLEAAADRLIVLERPRRFFAIGVHYRDFTQLPDDEVSRCLAAANRDAPASD